MTYTPPEQPAQGGYEPAQGGYQPAAPTGYQPYDAGQSMYGSYAAAPVSTKRTMSLWGLILGISSIVLPLFVNAIAGGVLSGIGLAKEPAGKTMAIWGLVLSVLGFIWAFIFWPLVFAVIVAAAFSSQYSY
ncbi:hypothetical protein [Agrococcus sp. HG114]|uniref:hypothetical protein n=1 Tax=Agrococcus sp. HG114 TaxID=2969757 RepID=UPI00215A1CC5|nr:hypothetical protein [Agrococcus sp. HG114]MCR8671054.1 hypothetical protein [Agrococcus sp. HG114]